MAGNSGRQRSFVSQQRAAQAEYFKKNFPVESGYRGSSYRLQPEHAHLNLLPPARGAIECFAAYPPIQWHQHANHGLSSQACCVNFLMPFNDDPDRLAQWIGMVTGTPVEELLSADQRAGRDYVVAFEWIGDVDYLNEGNSSGARKRGANATAADAAVKFRSSAGTELLLIEWKYTEQYRGHRLSEDRRQTRVKRYEKLVFAPEGPVRSGLGLRLQDFFFEPFYQLLRQQMLAWHVQHDPASGIDRARVLHLSPSGNIDLHHVTAPKLRDLGGDAFEVFRELLVQPENFIAMPIERAFASLSETGAPWFPALAKRYPALVAV